MRWERLFGELEGYAEHLRMAERDALVADLREGEWAEHSWIDQLAGGNVDAEIFVADVGVVAGRVGLANEQVVHVETSTAAHVVASSAVQWVRCAGRLTGVDRESVAARLGWGPVFREAQDGVDVLRLTLVGGTSLEGVVTAVGRDFVRIVSGTGQHRDVPTSAVRMASFSR